jgi:hypothetical protein
MSLNSGILPSIRGWVGGSKHQFDKGNTSHYTDELKLRGTEIKSSTLFKNSSLCDEMDVCYPGGGDFLAPGHWPR